MLQKTTSATYVQITANASSRVRYETIGTTKYLVAPVSMLVPGVLSGSKGPLLYPKDEVVKNSLAWNNIPLTLGHPTENGRPSSARKPHILHKYELGRVLNVHTDNGKLDGEAWFDITKTMSLDCSIISRLENGDPIELSTGLFTDNVPVKNESNYKGRRYVGVARNYKPDHLAVLIGSRGACILPGQKVQGRFVKGSKARYTGEAIRLVTASGKSLSVTANHPILTREGFVPAGYITEGQDLLNYVGEDKPTFIDAYKKNIPAFVENVFHALESMCAVEERTRSRAMDLDFHGDAKFFNGDIDIVSPHCSLRSNFIVEASQGLSKGKLSRGGNTQSSLPSSCHTLQLTGFVDSSDISNISSSSKLFTVCNIETGVPEPRSLGTATNDLSIIQPLINNFSRNSSFQTNDIDSFSSEIAGNSLINASDRESPSNQGFTSFSVVGPGSELDISLPELLSDSANMDVVNRGQVFDRFSVLVPDNTEVNNFTGDFLTGSLSGHPLPESNILTKQHFTNQMIAEIKLFSQLLNAFPGKILLDKVVSVDRFLHDGPVYDFETTTGYMVAENLIVSNCSIEDGCGVLVNQDFVTNCGDDASCGCGCTGTPTTISKPSAKKKKKKCKYGKDGSCPVGK